jgi:hypothetical protein
VCACLLHSTPTHPPTHPGLPTDNAHVVEIYRLQRSVKTSHLEDYLAEWAWAGCGPTIRWVDDAHALAVFPCAEAAQALLDSDQERYAVRPYCKASEQAREVPPEGGVCGPRGAPYFWAFDTFAAAAYLNL